MALARAYYKGKIPEAQIFRGQAELIMNSLKNSVDAATAKTTATIAKDIVAALQTRQEPERVVAFYMSVWKKRGWVIMVDSQVSPQEAAVSNAADDAPHSVQDEVGGISADAHLEAKMEAEVEEVHKPVLPNLSGLRLSEAVMEVFKFMDCVLTAEEVLKVFHDHGYEFHLNQVNSALQNLVRKEKLSKDDNYNTYKVAA